MDDCQVFFARSARKELEDLPSKVSGRIMEMIEKLQVDPRPPGCKKLEDSGNLWRVRRGDYRVLYGIDDAQRTVDILAVRHRGDAYR